MKIAIYLFIRVFIVIGGTLLLMMMVDTPCEEKWDSVTSSKLECLR